MKIRFLKRAAAILLAVCMIFPTCVSASEADNVWGVEAQADIPNKGGAFASGASSMAVNKLYTFGLSVTGKALTKLADTTGNEELESIVSFIDKWVFGNGQSHANAEIKELCRQILDELNVIEQTLANYTSEMEQMMAEHDVQAAYDKVQSKWESDVVDCEKNNGIVDAVKKYQEYMSLLEGCDPESQDAGQQERVDAARSAIFDEFWIIYTKDHPTSSGETYDLDRKRDLVFGDSTVSGHLFQAVTDMKNNLVKSTDNYADALAQLAYQALPYADQQYEFIRTGIDQWMTEIIVADLLCQEYLAQHAQYLEEKGLLSEGSDESSPQLTFVYGLLDKNESLTEELSTKICAMLDSELKVSITAGLSLRLDEYPTEGDAVEVVMKNTKYKASKTWNDVHEGDPFTSYPEYVDKYVTFRRVFTLTPSGIHSYYVKTGTADSMAITTMDFKCDVKNATDTHVPSVDYLNLFEGTYSDGTGTFRSAKNSSEIAELFHTNAYVLCGNMPQTYLADYWDYAKGKQELLIFPGYEKGDSGWWSTAYSQLTNVVDISKTILYADWTAGNNVFSLSLEDVQSGKKYHDAKFAMIMVDADGKEQHTIQLETNYSGSDIYLVKEDGTEQKESKVTLDAGSTYTVYFNPGDGEDVESLTLQRHDDASDKNKVTGETVLLTKEQIKGLEPDENGYYSFACPACYADATLYLKVQAHAYQVTIQNLRPNESAPDSSPIAVQTGQDGSASYAAGTTVSYTVDSAKVERLFLIYNKTYEELNPNQASASFTMPQSDVYLGYVLKDRTHTFDEDGFCINLYCGFYEPAVLNQDGVYEITNAGQMFWFASLVNGDKSHADFGQQNTSAKGVLKKDIDLKSLEWTPIQGYKGVFDGNGHTISNLKITTSRDNTGLFGSTVGATVKNLEVMGQIILAPTDAIARIAGVIGYADGGLISNVTSYVNITNTAGTLKHVGGVIGEVENNQATIEKCLYYGTMNISNSDDCIGGILGYSNGGAVIRNCANVGTVTTTRDGAFTGGILGYLNNTRPSVENCYNYGTVSNGENSSYCGAIIGYARNYGSGHITGNYYLEDQTSRAFGSESKSGLSAVAKPIEAFGSGEVAYLLNKGVTDGTQVWYQNIDNGKTPDSYPLFDGGTVYRITDSRYSNSQVALEFDQDDNGNMIIRTYEDLVKLAGLVRSDYGIYGSADYILENNIVAPSDSKWTVGIGSVSGDQPFNGTFNGNGYVIMGLNIRASVYGGLFEIIGENGRVENLFIINCTYATSCENAGSIAAINNGTIDHCTNGINAGSALIFKNPVTHDPIKASDFNSEIKGTLSGGIAAQNAGTITGCRNASIVAGTECGGIAGINTGKIYGCANNGTIGVANSSQTQTAGGIAGKNGGSIASSYNSAKVYGDSEEAVGSIAGRNGLDAKMGPEIKNVFYTTVNGLHGVGTGSSQTDLDASNIAKKQSDMHTDSFVDELNRVTDASVRWCRTSTLNNGYPKIENSSFEQIVRQLDHGITVKGFMHSSMNISYALMDENHAEYKDLVAAAIPDGNKKALRGYSVSLSDEKGNPMLAELWIQGEIEVSVPVDNEHVVLLGLDSDGQVVESSPVSYQNGVATFRLLEPMSFILADTAGASVTTGNSVKTGDDTSTVSGYLMLLSGGLLLAAAMQKKRKKING
ncbi:MAG: hypothetical protein K2N01_13160 [Lachnospiraceae bacterium]|nr:hypothetical protein [Lachnospiraceae bacterium]